MFLSDVCMREVKNPIVLDPFYTKLQETFCRSTKTSCCRNVPI